MAEFIRSTEIGTEYHRNFWEAMTARFLEHYELAAKRGVQSAKLALEQEGLQMSANQMAYWQDAERAIRWLKSHAKAWSRKNIV